MEDIQTIIIDCGAGYCKVGFNYDESPRFIFPTIIGKLKFQDKSKNEEYNNTVFVGDDALSKRGILNIKNPIEYGVISDWEGIQNIWEHCFKLLNVLNPSEYFILITDHPLNSNENRDNIKNIMFNKFNVKGIYISTSSLLSLQSTGRITGLVLESGEDMTYSVPIYNGELLTDGIFKIYIGGKNVTKYLNYLLNEKQINHDFNTLSSMEIIRNIKEKLCFVALDYNDEINKFNNPTTTSNQLVNYELPIGDIISIGDERFKCTEILFQTSFLGTEHYGIHETIYRSILKCCKNEKTNEKMDQLFENIILCGGNMLFKGMSERIEKELKVFAPRDQIINVILPDYKNSSFNGGTIISSLSNFKSICILNDNYK